MALTQAGMSREAAYGAVQCNAMAVGEDGGDFLANLTADKEVTRRLDAGALAKLFDPAWHTRRVDEIFARVFGTG